MILLVPPKQGQVQAQKPRASYFTVTVAASFLIYQNILENIKYF